MISSDVIHRAGGRNHRLGLFGVSLSWLGSRLGAHLGRDNGECVSTEPTHGAHMSQAIVVASSIRNNLARRRWRSIPRVE
jgi:hypothetical protein